jgi:hypothetical protein
MTQDDDQLPANPDVQHVTAHRIEGSEQVVVRQGRNFGCLSTMIVWSIGWITVACLAYRRFNEHAGFSAFVGLAVSVFFSFIAGSLALSMLRNARSVSMTASFLRSTPSFARRASGWLATVGWCLVAVLWNFGVFGLLARCAKEGDGWFILFGSIWAIIGLIPLLVLFTALSTAVNSLFHRDANT